MTQHRQQSTRVRTVGKDPIWSQVCSSLLQTCLFFSGTKPRSAIAKSYSSCMSFIFFFKETTNFFPKGLYDFTSSLMALHSSTLVWKIPWTEQPGRLQSMGSLRVRHDWATSLSLFAFMHWRRKRQPTPVFLPGESQGRGSLVGCRLWGHTESDTTEAT